MELILLQLLPSYLQARKRADSFLTWSGYAGTGQRNCLSGSRHGGLRIERAQAESITDIH
jgi:hypothetical protein